MWESNNLDGPAGEEPEGPDHAPEAQPAVPWTGPVLQGASTPRVFSALASAAGTPTSNGANGASAEEHEEDEEGENGLAEGDADVMVDGQIWSAEAAAARRRAQMRWRELNPGPPLPSLTLTEEEAAALLPPAEKPAEPAAAAVEPPRVAPWLPATRSQPAPAAAPVPSFGPVGRRRSPAMVVLFSVISLGFYALWWHHRVNREMAEFDTRMDVDPGMSTWAVALPLITGWMVAAAAGARYLLSLSGTSTADLPITAQQSLFLAFAPLVVPYLILLLPFSAAAVLMTHERARVVEDRVDTPVSRQLQPVTALGWLAVPIVGGLVGMARMQQHLNEVWRTVAP